MAQLDHHPEKPFWVIAANESQAVFYERDTRRAPLQQFFSAENEAGRKKTGQILADRGGRSFDSFGAGRHTMAIEKADPKKHAAMMFAKDIAERIGKATHSGRCRDYTLIAAPRFLGMLRNEVSKKCKFGPSRTVDKDVASQDAAALIKLLERE